MEVSKIMFILSMFCFEKRLHSKKNMVYGPYVGVDYNSPYLIVNSVASFPPLIQRERGGVGKISLVG